MAAVAVTEPDFGSDVAGMKVTATPARAPTARPARSSTASRRGARSPPAPTCCMLLARTDPDRSQDPPRPVDVRRAQAARRGPRLRVHPGGPATARGGKMEGRPIDTIGYRGMHSYEIAFDNWWVPAEQPHRRRGRPRQGLLPPDGGLRERPAADRGPRRRRDAGRVRGRARRTPQNRKVFGSPSPSTSSPR